MITKYLKKKKPWFLKGFYKSIKSKIDLFIYLERDWVKNEDT